MRISRRAFLKSGGVAMIGMSTLPAFLRRAVAADAYGEPQKAGGAVPARRGRWPEHRGAVRRAELLPHSSDDCDSAPRRGGDGAALDLDGFFGLHPSLAPLLPLFQKQQLAIVHAAGSPDTTRSHFDAQDYMESGTPGVKATDDGWLNRALQRSRSRTLRPSAPWPWARTCRSRCAASAPAIALPDIKQFRVFAQSPAVEGGFEALYAQNGGPGAARHRHGDV